MTAEARVAAFLLALAPQRGAGNPIDLPMSRGDIAVRLEMTAETVCRFLTLFAEARIIAIPSVSQVEIIEVDALGKVAQLV